MVEEIIKYGNSTSSETLELHVKDVVVEKLPGKGSKKLSGKVQSACEGILGVLEEEKIVYVDPSELLEKAKILHSKKGRKTHQDIHINSFSGDNVEGLRSSIRLRSHFLMKNFQDDLIHGYVFYGKTDRKTPIACIYEIRTENGIEEYILLDSRISGHPIAAWKVVDLLKQKYKKLHKQYSLEN